MAARRLLIAQSGLVLSLAAALALFVVVNLAGAKLWTQFDWTRSGLYSLSGQTTQVLRRLDRDLRIVSFLVERPGLNPDLLRQIRATLAAYESQNPRRIKVESIDPARDPMGARTLLTQFGLDPLRDSTDVVVVRAGARSKQLRLDEMADFDTSTDFGGPPTVRSLKIESALTSAILAVTRDRQPIVRIATGHGELDLQSAPESGLSRLAEALRRQDIQVDKWDALGAHEVPAGTDVVVVAGPASPWLPDERNALVNYLAGGGRVFLLLGPVLQRGGRGALVASGLEPLLAAWGISADGDIVIDPRQAAVYQNFAAFYAATLGLHPVTSSLRGQPLIYVQARSLSAVAPRPAGVEVNSLVETSADAWGKTDLADLQNAVKGAKDIAGPLTIAYAAARKPPETGGGGSRPGRLLVAGSVEMASNLLADWPTNLSFALNSISWLLEEDRALGIRPKEQALAKLFLTEQQMSSLFVLLVIVFPALAVGAGLGVWWRRKRN